MKVEWKKDGEYNLTEVTDVLYKKRFGGDVMAYK